MRRPRKSGSRSAAPPPERPRTRDAAAKARPAAEPAGPPAPALLALLGISLVLFGLRLYAASTVGFGDSEALYASWAIHPQPAYLDHPGLVGMVARAIGENAIPTALRVHVLTSIVATLVPWLAYAASRAFGASPARAAIAGLVLAVVPETAIGLFALTPDLLLAVAWLGALGLAAVALRAPPSSARSAAAFLGAGLLAGTACAAKVSGALLVAALFAAYVAIAAGRTDDDARRAARTAWPWAGLAAGLVVVAPIALYEAKTGWPMLHHRFVDTQTGAGIALRNVGALVGGQLLYVSPVFAALGVLCARDLVRARAQDACSKLLAIAFALPLVPLVALCLWSPVAEPHWLAPALLALPLHAARRATGGPPAASAPASEAAEGEVNTTAGGRALGSRRLFVVAAAVALLLTLGAHVWVLVPASARLLPADADPKLDLASELHGWPIALGAIRETMAGMGTPFDPEGREVVVVGPHWTVCAQLHAGLPGVRVGCATPIPDDFDGWLPRDDWRRAEHVLFVTDNRFPGDGAEQLPGHVQTAQSRVRIVRGGRTSRVFELFLYDRRASGSL